MQPLDGRRQNGQALGRSRGGFSTKIHLKTDFGGLPIAFDLTPGQASDSRHFSILLDLGPDIAPRAAIGDKGYDSKANREAARSRGICPVIPTKTNAKNRRKRSTALAPASSSASGNSSVSSALLSVARKLPGTMAPSSLSA